MTSYPADLWVMQQGTGPVIATAIHDGHEMRPDIAEISILDEAVRFREEDPYTGALTGVVDTWVVPRRSRFEVDLNRPRDRAVYRHPDDAWGLDLWSQPLEDEMVAESLATYDSFYSVLRGLLENAERRHGRFVVLDLHSYNHRREGPEEPAADPQGNPEVNIGTGSMDRSRWGDLVDRFMADMAEVGASGGRLDVRENIRFQGGHMSRWIHETFPESGCALAIEFKKVFMDEWTGVAVEAELQKLRSALASAVPGLIEELGRQ